MKKKLDFSEFEERHLPKEVIDFIEEGGALLYIDRDKMQKEELEALPGGYTSAEADILGRKYFIVMKDELSSAILDPSENDADILREAGRKTIDTLCSAYAKRQLKPLQTSFEQTLFERYVSSLSMNLVRYPKDKLNKNTLEQIGLYDREISKLYVNAATAWLGSSEGLEGIVKQKGIMSHLKNIGYTGRTEHVDLSVKQCHSGSHYELNIAANKKQLNVQLNAPELGERYQKVEDSIVSWIEEHASNETIREHARNFVRLYLNLTALYDADKPLPLEWK